MTNRKCNAKILLLNISSSICAIVWKNKDEVQSTENVHKLLPVWGLLFWIHFSASIKAFGKLECIKKNKSLFWLTVNIRCHKGESSGFKITVSIMCQFLCLCINSALSTKSQPRRKSRKHYFSSVLLHESSWRVNDIASVRVRSKNSLHDPWVSQPIQCQLSVTGSPKHSSGRICKSE